jgi:hypothetical protein
MHTYTYILIRAQVIYKGKTYIHTYIHTQVIYKGKTYIHTYIYIYIHRSSTRAGASMNGATDNTDDECCLDALSLLSQCAELLSQSA